MNNNNVQIVTHNGRFHMDEIFAIVTLAKFILKQPVSELNILRTRDLELLNQYLENPSVYVIDVGEKFEREKNNFDHHQNDPTLVWEKQIVYSDRKLDQILMSASGLMCQEINRPEYKLNQEYSEEQISKIKELLQKIDLCDNGRVYWCFTPIFSGFNTEISNPATSDSQFMATLNEAETYLNNLLYVAEDERMGEDDIFELALGEFYSRYPRITDLSTEIFNLMFNVFKPNILNYFKMYHKTQTAKVRAALNTIIDNLKYKAEKNLSSKVEIEKAIENACINGHEEIVIFYEDSFNARFMLPKLSQKAILFATYYSSDNEWAIMSVNKYEDDPYLGKVMMPEIWAGKRDLELEDISGHKGLFYCHKLRFLALFRGSEKDCVRVCEDIIKASKLEKE